MRRDVGCSSRSHVVDSLSSMLLLSYAISRYQVFTQQPVEGRILCRWSAKFAALEITISQDVGN